MFARPLVASPIDIVIQLIQTVWTVYVVGTFRMIPRIATWMTEGGWFGITMKFGVVFLALVLCRSMWKRLSDVSDANPMTPVIAVALILGLMIATMVGGATGLWQGLKLPF